MQLKVIISIKAILFGVTESVIGNLDIGNGYVIKKDSMINNMVWKEFDYTDFGIRRIYEKAKINNKLDVAVLTKEIELDAKQINSNERNGIYIDDIVIDKYADDLENEEAEYIDVKMRLVRLLLRTCFFVLSFFVI